jgi:hypothetical protein
MHFTMLRGNRHGSWPPAATAPGKNSTKKPGKLIPAFLIL